MASRQKEKVVHKLSTRPKSSALNVPSVSIVKAPTTRDVFSDFLEMAKPPEDICKIDTDWITNFK